MYSTVEVTVNCKSFQHIALYSHPNRTGALEITPQPESAPIYNTFYSIISYPVAVHFQEVSVLVTMKNELPHRQAL